MRILLLSPSFFGYEQSIADSFRAQGHAVDFVDERPSNAGWARATVRIAPFLLRRRLRHYYQNVWERIRTTAYDGLLVVKGEVVPHWFIQEFASRNPAAIKIYYAYDALANSSQGLRVASLCDRRYTFDRADAAGRRDFEYKPLFFTECYRLASCPRTVDLLFVGTVHGDRFDFLQKAAVGIAHTFFYLYSPARWHFELQRLTSSRYRRIPRSEVHFVALHQREVAELMQGSRAVLDLPRRGQSGLTMRTFEALASGAALITANGSIRAEPFFDPSRILIVSAEPASLDPHEIRSFVASQPRSPEALDGIEQYSLSAWTRDLVRVLSERPT